MELPEQTTPPKFAPTQTKKGFPLLLVAPLLLLLIAVFLTTYFLFFRSQNESSSETGKQATASVSQKTKESEKYEVVYVSAQEGLNLREQASTDSDIILLLPYGTELKVLGSESSDWYYAEAQTRGFVAKEFTTQTKPNVSIKTFSNPDSPFTFLYHEVYKVDFSKQETTLEYSFTGNDSYGGFRVEIEAGLQTLGNYALTKYPNAKRSACDVKFGAGRKECEKVEDSSGTIYLVLVNTNLYKFTYLKTEGGVLEDLKNIVFYSLFFK